MIAAIDTMCSSMPSERITSSVARMVSGTMPPTTTPARQPRNSTTTIITITIVSIITWFMRPISRSTTSAWKVT